MKYCRTVGGTTPSSAVRPPKYHLLATNFMS